jgi:tRNA modification GTPase
MTEHNDTICAISTPPGVGGIAVIRVSGPEAIATVDSVWKGKRLVGAPSHTAHLGTIIDTDGTPLDQAVATIFIGPRSYTGDDTVELSVHGSKYIQQRLLSLLITRGCRLAEPGEYTRRAYSSGNIDLTQAEAIADLIASDSRASHRIAMNQMRGAFSRSLKELREQLLDLSALLELELDFSEEDVTFASRQQLRDLAEKIHDRVSRLCESFNRGTAIKNGIPVAIVGTTNAGKSSLLNALVGDDRAIVSDIHGTTRDIVEDTIQLGDYTFRLKDTAGLRETTDAIERIGIDRSHQALEKSTIAILIIDPANMPDVETLSDIITTARDRHLIVAVNKTDIADPTSVLQQIDTEYVLKLDAEARDHVHPLAISAKTGEGLDRLRSTILDIATGSGDQNPDDIIITNARHEQALHNATLSTARILDGLAANLSADFIAQDLRETLHHLGTITGDVTPSDILQTIFSRFCIGK